MIIFQLPKNRIAHSASRNLILNLEALAKATYAAIPTKAKIKYRLKSLDSGSRFACPE